VKQTDIERARSFRFLIIVDTLKKIRTLL